MASRRVPTTCRRNLHWVGTWTTAPVTHPGAGANSTRFNNQTLRQIVRLSLGGSDLRPATLKHFWDKGGHRRLGAGRASGRRARRSRRARIARSRRRVEICHVAAGSRAPEPHVAEVGLGRSPASRRRWLSVYGMRVRLIVVEVVGGRAQSLGPADNGRPEHCFKSRRSDRDSSPCPTRPRSPARISPARRRTRRPLRGRGARSSSRR
jgi:hypothetical protein